MDWLVGLRLAYLNDNFVKQWFDLIRIVYENQRFSQEYSAISRSLEATKRARWIFLAVDLSTKRHKVD